MTFIKAFIFKIIGFAFGIIALICAIFSFDALGFLSIIAVAACLVGLVLLKIGNGYKRTLLGNLSFLVVFAVMIFAFIALGIAFAFKAF